MVLVAGIDVGDIETRLGSLGSTCWAPKGASSPTASGRTSSGSTSSAVTRWPRAAREEQVGSKGTELELLPPTDTQPDAYKRSSHRRRKRRQHSTPSQWAIGIGLPLSAHDGNAMTAADMRLATTPRPSRRPHRRCRQADDQARTYPANSTASSVGESAHHHRERRGRERLCLPHARRPPAERPGEPPPPVQPNPNLRAVRVGPDPPRHHRIRSIPRNLARLPDLLVGGPTRAGKSGLLSNIIGHISQSHRWPNHRPGRQDRRTHDVARSHGLLRRAATSHSPTTPCGDSSGDEQPLRLARGRRRRKIVRGDGIDLIYLPIDELSLHLHLRDQGDQQEEFIDLFMDLVTRGPAAAIVPVAATQRPSAASSPPAAGHLLLPDRVPMRHRRVLRHHPRHGWSEQGFDASKIDLNIPGVGYCMAEEARPFKFRSIYLERPRDRHPRRRSMSIRGSMLREHHHDHHRDHHRDQQRETPHEHLPRSTHQDPEAPQATPTQ